MSSRIRSELVKLRSTRTVPALLLAMVALMVFVIVLHGVTQAESRLAGATEQRNLLAMGMLAALFAAYVGAIAVTAEFRYGTIRATLLATPSRGRVIAAKLGVSAAAGVLFGLVGQAAAYAVLRGVLSARGIDFAVSGGDVAQLFAGTVAMAALWGALGVAVGACVRNQVATIVGLSVWVLLVETLLTESTKTVARFAPLGAGAAIGGAEPGMLAPLAGGALLVGYVAALVAAALAVTRRRDVV